MSISHDMEALNRLEKIVSLEEIARLDRNLHGVKRAIIDNMSVRYQSEVFDWKQRQAMTELRDLVEALLDRMEGQL